jgi:ribose-phosphate pyrophosphokinase
MSTVVFSTGAYRPLRDELCSRAGFEAGEVETRTFPDGERYLRVRTDVAGRPVVVAAGTISDSATLELYDLASTLVANGAHDLTLVLPFFGYSTMERAARPGEAVTAKTRARLLSSIPAAGSRNRVLLLDLHTEGIPHYFEGAMRPFHVYGKPFVERAARRLFPDGFVLACTDAGRAKWVESLANDLGVPASFVYKRRLSGSETAVTAVSAFVDGRDVILYDDMIRTGGSLVHAAEAYRAAGARRLAAITTHGLFPDDALARLRATGLFTSIVATDSHPRARDLAGDFLTVESVAPLFLPFLRPPLESS